MKKSIKIKQHDITDCAAACLASISENYGLKLPIAKIRQYASTDKKGTNVLGVIEAANKLGFTAKGVKGPFESLFKIPKPAIAHLIVKETLNHFVVIYNINKKKVTIMDPGVGKIIKLSHAEFKKQWTGVLIIMMPDENFTTGNEKISITKRFYSLLNPHKSIITQAFIGAIIYTLLGLSTSIYVQKIIDFVLVDGNKNLLNLMSIVMIILLLLQIYIGSVKSIFVLKTGQKIDATLILGYYKHLMTLPQQFFDTMRVGEIISRVNDAIKIRTFINDISLELLVNILIVIFSFSLMFLYSVKLALALLISIPLYFLVYLIINKLNKKYQRKIMENATGLETQLVESLNSVSTIKRFGLEQFANLKTETSFIKLLKSTYKSGRNAIFSSYSSEFLSRIFTIVILWFGSTLVIAQSITPGVLISFYALIGYLTGPISKLINMNKSIQDAVIAADRLFEIMDVEREEIESKKIELTKEMINDIHFNNVFFRYGSRVQVFENFNLTISKAKVTAVIGESGSGKTTLVALLQNIYPLQSGSIEIGKHNIKHFSNGSLRKLVSIVPQKIDLFATSILENIAIGDFDINMDKVVNICNTLRITEFIENLPNGFHTYIGENGLSLSGGQKQRIAIARALYKDPEILILDEATSSLDSAAEQYVKDAIQYLKSKNKIIIVIAHRLSTIMNADEIILLKKGKVIEIGTHNELLSKKEHYYQLWEQQFQGLTKL